MAYDGYMIVFYCAVALNYSNEAVAYRNSGSGLCGGGGGGAGMSASGTGTGGTGGNGGNGYCKVITLLWGI